MSYEPTAEDLQWAEFYARHRHKTEWEDRYWYRFYKEHRERYRRKREAEWNREYRLRKKEEKDATNNTRRKPSNQHGKGN